MIHGKFWKYRLIGLVSGVFANGPGDLGSIPGRVIPKTLKLYLIPPCLTLSNIRYAWRVKWSNTGKGVAPSPTPRCSSYWKESLLVALDYGRQLYFTIYIYIYMYIHKRVYVCVCVLIVWLWQYIQPIQRLGNCVHCTFILTFVCCCLLRVFFAYIFCIHVIFKPLYNFKYFYLILISEWVWLICGVCSIGCVRIYIYIYDIKRRWVGNDSIWEYIRGFPKEEPQLNISVVATHCHVL